MTQLNKPQRINELSPFNLENLAPTVAQLEGFDESGQPLLNVAGRTVTGKMVARLGDFSKEALLGQQALVVFENNDPNQPIAIDLIYQPTESRDNPEEPTTAEATDVSLTADTIIIKADERLELRVGKSSIVIDDSGKITTRSKTQLSRASGPIRIKGGHVDIN